jgi:hypothetical protein
MRECISVHIGQAGVQIGNACWELYCLGKLFRKINENIICKNFFKAILLLFFFKEFTIIRTFLNFFIFYF